MVEIVNASEKASFNPQLMARLESGFYRNSLEGNKEKAHKNHIAMYMEQWKMPEDIAIVADVYFAKGMVYGCYGLIREYSDLDFDPNDVGREFWNANTKADFDDPIPISEASKLFGLIYGIDPQDETLQEAMDLRGSGFNLLHQRGSKMDDEDWEDFEGYMTDYYRYLKWAANG